MKTFILFLLMIPIVGLSQTHTGAVKGMAFSGDNTKLATITPSDIKFWDVASGKMLNSSSIGGYNIKFYKDNLWLILSTNYTFKIVDGNTGTIVDTLELSALPKWNYQAFALFKGKYLLVKNRSDIILYNLEDHKIEKQTKTNSTIGEYIVAVDEGADLFYIVYKESVLSIKSEQFSLNTFSVTGKYTMGDFPANVVAHDGRYVAGGSYLIVKDYGDADGQIHMVRSTFSLPDELRAYNFPEMKDGNVNDLCANPLNFDDIYFIGRNNIAYYNLKTKKPKYERNAPGSYSNQKIAISPNGEYLAVASIKAPIYTGESMVKIYITKKLKLHKELK